MERTSATGGPEGGQASGMAPGAHIETIVIGAGQAGLATAYYLTRLGRQFLILDASQDVGQSWRHRWDSLRLFTPAGFSHLPGMPMSAPARSHPSKDDTAAYLRDYARRFNLPVTHGVRVDEVVSQDGGLLVRVGTSQWQARNVVVATGAHHVPRIPSFANKLDSRTQQLHSVNYRNPTQIRPGPVLVVGAGNSGAEIALDLAPHHETLWLSGRDVGHLPRVGNPIFRLMRHITVASAIGRRIIDRARASGGDPLGRVKPRDLTDVGIERRPKVVGERDGAPRLADGRVLHPSAVVWCTGFTPDYGWLKPVALNQAGWPEHERGVAAVGVYFVGLPFQSSLASHLMGGVGSDAEYVARHIADHAGASLHSPA